MNIKEETSKISPEQELLAVSFDVLDNDDACCYLFRMAKVFFEKEQEILKLEREEKEKMEKIEKEMKEEAEIIEKYVSRYNELS